jgi:rSAM/selenodomain-associated transferase 2
MIHYRPVVPLVSVIVPVLDDTAATTCLIKQIPDDPRVDVVIADARSDAALAAAAGLRPGTRVIPCSPGRGRQMNAGAAVARGDWLVFLHADSRLPDGWLEAIADLTADVSGGWFRFALDADAWQARVVERLVAWRVRALRLPYGDQGLFVRRAMFAALGGYREWPLLEDVEFVQRLVRAGTIAELPLPLYTSARRWRRDGWLRRSLRNGSIIALYFAGVSPQRLAKWY